MRKFGEPPARRIVGKVWLDPSAEKEIIWWPDNLREEIKKSWPLEIRKEVGYQLGRVQQGLEPDHYRNMPTVGSGVREIKLQDEVKSQYRLIYIAKFDEAIYAIHVVTKKTTAQTDPKDIELATKRLKEIIEHRKKSKHK